LGLTARDVMDTRFYTLRPEATVAEAVRGFEEAGRKTGRAVFGMMVTDSAGNLLGLLFIYTTKMLSRLFAAV
jgi:Mg/Co/Ni transporter MgtE